MTPLPSETIFLGRQPILDASQAVIGYELLFRARAEDESAHFESAACATAQVICTAFTEFGIAMACTTSRLSSTSILASLNPTPSNCCRPNRSCSNWRRRSNAATLARCHDLRAAGYECRGRRSTHARNCRLRRCSTSASYIKIDVASATAEQVAAVAKS